MFRVLEGDRQPLPRFLGPMQRLVYRLSGIDSREQQTWKEYSCALIGQGFVNPASFQPRPSVAGEKGYDATSSSGSNLGPTSKKLRDRINDDLKRLKEQNPDIAAPVPAELVTTSASGLDPHLSPEAMLWQLPRVAKARGVAPERAKAVVDSHVEGRTTGILGEPRVNVLKVNLALDRQFGRPAPLAAE
jgi:K+-transporting ATPase ATPase C chain